MATPILLQRDRGQELNERRLRGEAVDVTFSVGGRPFPAHKFVVALHSPYLKAVVFRRPEFSASVSVGQPLLLEGVDPEGFGEVLSFLYAGQLSVTRDNVFRLLATAQFLQLDERDGLVQSCVAFLIDWLPTCSLETLFNVWNVCEQFDLDKLRKAILSMMEFRLDDLLRENLFSFLGCEEIMQVLSHPGLCVGDEKALFDHLSNWCVEQADDDQESRELASQLLSLLPLRLINPEYVKALVMDYLGPEAVHGLLARGQRVKRKCVSCCFLFEYTRSENEIMGIEDFLRERKDAPNFAVLDLQNLRCGVLPTLTAGRSYFQHYGLHSTSGSRLLRVGSEIWAMGGLKRSSRESLLSNEIKVLDTKRGVWQSIGGILPKDLIHLGVVEFREDIFIFGGLTDSCCLHKSSKARLQMERNVNISCDVFKIKRDHLSAMNRWQQLSSMPRPRTHFSVARVDSTVFLVGDGFCDSYDLLSDQWTEDSAVPSSVGDSPGLAALGSYLYVAGARPQHEGSNAFFCVDVTSRQWRPLGTLPARQDVTAAFVHNGLVYVLGWQAAASNMLHSYDPQTGEWTLLVSNIRGKVKSGGVLIKRQLADKTLFYGMSPIKGDTCQDQS